MTDHLTENARLRAALEAMLHRHILYCGGESMAFAGHTDVALFQEARAALATPAPDAVQEAPPALGCSRYSAPRRQANDRT